MKKSEIIGIILSAAILITLTGLLLTNNTQSTDEIVTTEPEIIASETVEIPVQSQDNVEISEPGALNSTDHLVTYTQAGFSPRVLEAQAGDTIVFRNDSNTTLWVTSQNHPTATDQHYPELDSHRSLSQGESFTLTALREGNWGYKNLNDEQHLGALVITPQEIK